jgi:hypothetical protein
VLSGVTPRRGDHRVTTRIKLTGDEFLAGGAQVTIGSASVQQVDLVDDETIACDVPPGDPGPVDITVETDYGAARLAGGFVRTPALLVEGAPAIGEDLTLKYWVEPGDFVMSFFGLPPAENIRVGPLGYHLAIRPFVVFLVARSRTDELIDVVTIPADPNLVGMEVLIQAVAKSRGNKRGSYTNYVSITIE